MGQLMEVQVPDIGDYRDVPVIEVLVKDGDAVAPDQPLIVLESEKATMEVPSPGAGTVRGFKVKVGDKLSKGDRICRLEGEASAEAQSPPPASAGGGREGGGAGTEQFPKEVPTPAPRPAAPSQPSPASGGGLTSVTIPDIGDYKDVPVIELLVKNGDAVEKDATLLVLESEKATMEVPAPIAGTVRDLKLKVGDKVSKGDAVCALEGAAEAKPAAPARPASEPASAAKPEAAAPPAPKPAPSAPTSAAPTEAGPPAAVPYAGPATRKFARELGVDLAQVKGTGAKNRIVIEDVQAHVKQALKSPPPAPTAPGSSGIPPIPPQDFSLYGEVETKPMARIRKLSAAYLHRAWLNIPHVTQTDDADITDLEAFRKSQSEGGVKLTLLPFIMKACAQALRQYPEMGSSLSPDGGNLIYKKYCHIGFAADTPNGLLVPVVKDVWSKGIVVLAQDTAELAKKARDGKLKPDEMKGGVFSISSLGGIGGSHFTPIVNAPEVGILGVSRGVMKPVWDGSSFQPRLMLPLSLSYDHRVIDGAYAARFIVHLVKLLSDVRQLAL